MELSREKILWLESIGAMAFPEPIKYAYTFPGYTGVFNLSERCVADTPLEELKSQYSRNEEHVRLCLNGTYSSSESKSPKT